MTIRVLKLWAKSALGTHKNCDLKNPIGSITLDAGVTDHLRGTRVLQSPLTHPIRAAPTLGKRLGKREEMKVREG